MATEEPAGASGAIAGTQSEAEELRASGKEHHQVSEKLEEVTEELKALPGGGVALPLAPARKVELQELPSPPEVCPICPICGRPGHPRCGKGFWNDQRAVWLRMPSDQVEAEPSDFEDDGPLRTAILEARAQEAASGEGSEGECEVDLAASSRGPFRDESGELLALGDSEREALEDCLDATQRPYPKLKRPLQLPQAVRCAEELWAED